MEQKRTLCNAGKSGRTRGIAHRMYGSEREFHYSATMVRRGLLQRRTFATSIVPHSVVVRLLLLQQDEGALE
jgi:hypothetical protein